MDEAQSSTRKTWPRLAAVVGAVVFLLLAWRLHDGDNARQVHQGYWIPPAELPASDAPLDAARDSNTPVEQPTDPRAASPVARDAESTVASERSEPATSAPPPLPSFVPSTLTPTGSRHPRVAVVDMQRLFNAHPITRSHEATISQRLTHKNAEPPPPLDGGDPAAAQRIRDAEEKELQEEASQLRARVVTDLRQRIAAAVSKGDFDLVFDLSGKSLNGVPVILQAPGSYDLTNDLLSELSR